MYVTCVRENGKVKPRKYYLRKWGVGEIGELMEYNRGVNFLKEYLCTYGITQ
jgi:hypothetical protein